MTWTKKGNSAKCRIISDDQKMEEKGGKTENQSAFQYATKSI